MYYCFFFINITVTNIARNLLILLILFATIPFALTLTTVLRFDVFSRV